jgi:hypothetical protein
MATTAKELIEILQKYTKPDDVVIWQYYTLGDFDYDDSPVLTNEQFAEVAEELRRWDLWEGIPDRINEAIESYQVEKGLI